MTIVVLATGHQVRCILWEQVVTFNKEIFFLMWIKIIYIEYILWRTLSTKSMFAVANMLILSTVKDVTMNNYELLNTQACSFILFWNRGCTQTLVVSSKYWVFPWYPLEFQAIVHHHDSVVCKLMSVVNKRSTNSSPPSAEYMRQWIGSALLQIMACRLFGTKPLSKPMLGYCQLDPSEQTSVEF